MIVISRHSAERGEGGRRAPVRSCPSSACDRPSAAALPQPLTVPVSERIPCSSVYVALYGRIYPGGEFTFLLTRADPLRAKAKSCARRPAPILI